jgi:hypothetical protein
MEPDILKRIYHKIAEGKLHPIYGNKDFYIEIIFRIQHIGQAIDPLIVHRSTCPTPSTAQAAIKYHNASGAIEWLWTLPTPITYYSIINNMQKFLDDKETQQSAQFCYLHHTGDLLKWVIKENGEKQDALIILNKNK